MGGISGADAGGTGELVFNGDRVSTGETAELWRWMVVMAAQ
jgi:hypothetical protein